MPVVGEVFKELKLLGILPDIFSGAGDSKAVEAAGVSKWPGYKYHPIQPKRIAESWLA